MKIAQFLLLVLLVTGLTTSCRRSRGDVWEDTKSGSRYMGTGLRKMGGKHGDSRQIRSKNDFYVTGNNDAGFQESEFLTENQFVPLQDEYGQNMICMSDIPAPREIPGDPGSSLPGIEAFIDPTTSQRLAPIFQNIQFDLNSHLIKGEANLAILREIANYMRQHPETYIFVEGHTCEKGPEAYNLALGSRRANAVRNMLIGEGVSPDNIFTISYGKERPLLMENHEEAWIQNRRAEFKIYER